MAGQRCDEVVFEYERQKAKWRWPKNIILSFPPVMRKFCVNNPAMRVYSPNTSAGSIPNSTYQASRSLWYP
jgi:hypothetical protein